MPKPTNQATFSTGKTIARNGKVVYSFAWLATGRQESGSTYTLSGFAPTEQKAKAAAASHIAYCTKGKWTFDQHSEVVAVD